MRYTNIDLITFTNQNGTSTLVYDMRLIPSEAVAKTVDFKGFNELDEIASRKDIYGDFGESQTYRIFEANVKEITDAKFDMTKIRSVKIPL
jgi:hypothetical protein